MALIFDIKNRTLLNKLFRDNVVNYKTFEADFRQLDGFSCMDTYPIKTKWSSNTKECYVEATKRCFTIIKHVITLAKQKPVDGISEICESLDPDNQECKYCKGTDDYYDLLIKAFESKSKNVDGDELERISIKYNDGIVQFTERYSPLAVLEALYLIHGSDPQTDDDFSKSFGIRESNAGRKAPDPKLMIKKNLSKKGCPANKINETTRKLLDYLHEQMDNISVDAKLDEKGKKKARLSLLAAAVDAGIWGKSDLPSTAVLVSLFPVHITADSYNTQWNNIKNGEATHRKSTLYHTTLEALLSIIIF